jgi:hypothetical protein
MLLKLILVVWGMNEVYSDSFGGPKNLFWFIWLDQRILGVLNHLDHSIFFFVLKSISASAVYD